SWLTVTSCMSSVIANQSMTCTAVNDCYPNSVPEKVLQWRQETQNFLATGGTDKIMLSLPGNIGF
ncbi:MAG: hypothetical protein WBN57_05715, partial [Gammaproteobacteria bacterium]